MAQEVTIHAKCPHCGGDGQKIHGGGVGGITLPCDWLDCSATGFITLGKFTADPGFNEVMAVIESIQTSVNAIKAKTDNLPADTATVLSDLADKVDDTYDKCIDIKEKCDEIWDEVKP